MNQTTMRALRRKHWLLTSLLVCTFICAGIAVQWASAQTFPELSGRVVDQAQILDDSTIASLDAILESHEAQSSNQIVVVSVSSLEGYAIADYANRLGRAWQIGTAENDNGVLLLVAPAEREVRIEVGYGLEGALTDALSSVIIQREILPAFRSNNYELGVSKGVNAIISAVEGEYTPPQGNANRGTTLPADTARFLPLLFIAIVAVSEVLRRTGRRKAANGAFPAGFSGLFATLASGKLYIGIPVAIAVFLFIYFKGSGGGGSGGLSARRRGYIGTGGIGRHGWQRLWRRIRWRRLRRWWRQLWWWRCVGRLVNGIFKRGGKRHAVGQNQAA